MPQLNAEQAVRFWDVKSQKYRVFSKWHPHVSTGVRYWCPNCDHEYFIEEESCQMRACQKCAAPRPAM